MKTPNSQLRKNAFTLVEMLVSISIIVVLATIGFLSMKKAKESASAAVDAGEMRQISAAVMLYTSDNNDILPVTSGGVGPLYNERGKSLSMRCAPYLGYTDMEDGHFMKEFASANWQSARKGEGNGPAMLAMHRVYTGKGKPKNIKNPDPYCLPFGYPNWNGRQRDGMQLSAALAKMGDPANRLMLIEIDLLIPNFGNPGWKDTVPEGMAHGTYRLGLFWDGHVGRLNVNLESL